MNQLQEKIVIELKDMIISLEAGCNIKTAISNLNLCLEPLVGFDHAMTLSSNVKTIVLYARKADVPLTISLLLAG